MIHSIQKTVWACVLAGGLANAEIWESTITFPEDYYIWFDTASKVITGDYNGEYVEHKVYGKVFARIPDIIQLQESINSEKRYKFFASYTEYVEINEFFDDPSIVDFSTSNPIYYIKDVTKLNFSKPLPLDSEFYKQNIVYNKNEVEYLDGYEYVYLLGYGLYGKQYPLSENPRSEENFLFKTLAGYYALCHASFNTKVIDSYGNNYLTNRDGVTPLLTPFSSIGPITLTCAVQTDGTTKFDSLPWHPDPVSVLPSVRSHKLKSSNTGLYYGADGSRIQSPHRRVWQVLGE